MKKVLTVLLCFVFYGCGAQMQFVMPTLEKLDSYNVGQLQEKTVGETMVFKMDAVSLPGFIAVADYNIPGSLMIIYPEIKPGFECSIIGILENGDVLCSLSTLPTVRSAGTVKWSYCLVFNSAGEPYGDTQCYWVNVRAWGEKPISNLFKRTKIFLNDSFRQELIYNGRSKDMLKIQYREYKNDLAKPAFYQDLIYDLSESKEIGFRGMTIEIIEATNSYVKFIVKSKLKD